MNEIKVKRLVLAGFLTLVVFILTEILVETFLEQVVCKQFYIDLYLGLGIPRWGLKNHLLNIGIGLVNCMMLIWLYAALRPMFGVGVKTALITSLYWLVFVTAFSINMANLGYYPWSIALVESIYLLIELPVALIAGAYFYEYE
ncbi:MAG: hypothetical protein WBB69_04400 [Anaerolineales bacterium]